MEYIANCCPICFEGFKNDCKETEEHMNRCGHSFHKSCMVSSIRTGLYSCPICRQPLGEENEGGISKSFKKYAKMLQANIPTAAVRQRMTVDGINTSDIDAFFTGGASTALYEGMEISPVLAATNFSPYTKMMKVGMNEGAVRQRMQAAGLSDKEIDNFFCDFMDGKFDQI